MAESGSGSFLKNNFISRYNWANLTVNIKRPTIQSNVLLCSWNRFNTAKPNTSFFSYMSQFCLLPERLDKCLRSQKRYMVVHGCAVWSAKVLLIVPCHLLAVEVKHRQHSILEADQVEIFLHLGWIKILNYFHILFHLPYSLSTPKTTTTIS